MFRSLAERTRPARAPVWLALVAGAALVGAVVVSAPAAVHAAEESHGDVPDEYLTPTPTQVANSVRTWDPSRSVKVWDPSDAVQGLVREAPGGDESTITLTSDVMFAFGSADITDAAANALADVVSDVPDGASVTVSGHTDSVGSPEDNLALSTERAQAVADALADARPDLRLDVKGYGETRPIADNARGGEDYPPGRAENRRVEITYEG